VRHGLDDIAAQPLTEFHHTLLMARGAKMPPLARKGQKVLMTAGPATHPRKAVVQVAAVQVAIDHLPDIGPEKPVLPLKTLLIDLLEGLKMILYTLVIEGILRLPRSINRL
jgi:hypothetical protein